MQWLIAQTEVAKTGMTFWDFVTTYWPAVGVGVASFFVSCGYVIRQIWAKVDLWLERRHQIAEIQANAEAEAKKLKAIKEAKALEMMSESLPQIAENGKQLGDTLKAIGQGQGDIIRTQVALHAGIMDFADACTLNACPDVAERFAKDVQRGKDRVKAIAPQEFLDRIEKQKPKGD